MPRALLLLSLAFLFFIACNEAPNESKNTFTDPRDGQAYKIALIGKQTWMAENLNYEAAGSACYDSKLENCAKYGRMYKWEAAKEACPPGWHLPSQEEWDNLVAEAGGYNIAGKKLKARSKWSASIIFDYFYKGTDDFGFSALPAPYRSFDRNNSDDGFWWAATDDSSCARTYYMSHRHDAVVENCDSKDSDYSVRCVDGSQEEAIATQKAREAAKEAEIAKNSITIADARDGKKYRAVKIGKQTWMAENMNYKADSSWCYDNDESNCAQYGRLYSWKAAKAACPSGWHLPTSSEWKILLKTANSKMLKAKNGWKENRNGTDEFGFSAMPGGHNFSDNHFSSIGEISYWWTATEYDADAANSLKLWYFDHVDFDESGKYRGLSARCLQN